MEAVELARPAALSVKLAAHMKEARELPSEDEDRSTLIDLWEARFEPIPHGVLVHSEQLRDLLHRVTSMDFHAPRIEPPQSVEPV